MERNECEKKAEVKQRLTFLLRLKMSLQSVRSYKLHPIDQLEMKHRGGNAQVRRCSSTNMLVLKWWWWELKKKKRRSHDVRSFLYAHIPTNPTTTTTRVSCPRPGAHRNRALEKEPGFVAGSCRPIREKECCLKPRPLHDAVRSAEKSQKALQLMRLVVFCHQHLDIHNTIQWK